MGRRAQLHWRPTGTSHELCAVHATDKILCLWKPRTTGTRILLGFFILYFWVPNRYFFRWLDWNSPYNTVCGEITRLRKVKQFSCELFFSTFIQDEPYNLLVALAFNCILILSIFCVFSVRENVEISSINAGPDFPGYYSSSTNFLEFNSFLTQPFNAWLNTKFIT